MAGEEGSSLGRLTILQARMNPDLAMGDELLKKTGTGNLCMVFGEPDIDVRPAGQGTIEVEVRGLDVYGPQPPMASRSAFRTLRGTRSARWVMARPWYLQRRSRSRTA